MALQSHATERFRVSAAPLDGKCFQRYVRYRFLHDIRFNVRSLAAMLP